MRFFLPRLSRPVRFAAFGVISCAVIACLWAFVFSPGALSSSSASSDAPVRPVAAPTSSGTPSSGSSAASASPKRQPPSGSASRADDPALRDEIDRLLDRWQAGQAFWGISIIDLSTGTPLYERNPEKGFLPASNQKIFTTATALNALGADHRYETTLRFQGATEGAVMRGDFVIKGSGDPTFGSSELPGTDPLSTWAERLAEMGVERVEGRLIGDDNRFDDRPYPEGWDVDYITKQAGRYIGASAGGLSYNDNAVAVRIAASTPGTAPRVRIRPDGAVNLKNDAVTSRRWRGSTLQVDRVFDTNRLLMTGSVARSYRGTVTVPVSDPTAFTLQSFVAELNDVGIETNLDVIDIDDLDGGTPGGEVLFVHLSPPLTEIVGIVNKRSNNFYAEQLFRTYGWGGSTRGAGRRTEAFLRRAGIDTRPVHIYDGSGLSRKDLMTPTAMVRLLRHMDGHEARDAFRASLPSGGENNTTLEYRLRREPVFAKTGSLRYVRSLSGYALRPDGTRIAFSIFANNYTGPSYQITRTIDDVVRALTRRRGT